MSQRSETFGRLLKGAINSIAAYEGKSAPAIEEELGAQIGVAGSSIQRYKAGYLPTEPRAVQVLAEAAVRRGFLSRAWLQRFLQAARYPAADTLIAQLSDGTSQAGYAGGERGLPSGTLTFLFTDIEGSTTRWERQPQAMERALARHDELLRQAIDAYGGQVVKTVGDAFQAVFTTAPDALEAALAAQRALQAEAWGPIEPLGARMALHVGVVQQRDGEYFGHSLNRVARLCAAGHGGQLLLSNAAQELVHDALPPGTELRDLGEHQLKDLARREHIFQVVAPGLPTDFPPLRTLERYTHNLPAHPTPFIGREAEVQAVVDLLRREGVRLATLTGPGGIGKTRLALQVAAELLDEFPDGVYFIPLAPIREPTLVAGAIAQVLGVKELGDQPLVELLKRVLQRRHVLLLLDNFEQVVAAAPLVNELLAAAPNLHIIVTSREVLHLSGEHEYPVPALSLPDIRRLPPLERLTQYEAVRLFIERAQAVRPDFTITAENAPAVAQICARLDGLPLAIELAAARSKLFPPKVLLARLEKRLSLLTGGARDLPARQQTLRSAIAWSYDLLDATEQALFARLGVFAGGCTLALAEQVASNVDADNGDVVILDLDAVLDGLSALVDRSLLWRIDGPDGEPRFGMLETIREYALEQLTVQGEVALFRDRHAVAYARLCEQAGPALKGAQQQVWLTHLAAEDANLQAALEWTLHGGGNSELGLQMAGNLHYYWQFLQPERGNQWLDVGLTSTKAHGAAPWVRTRALIALGDLSMLLNKFDRSKAALEESLTLARRQGEPAKTAEALFILAELTRFRGDLEQAIVLAEESYAIAQSLQQSFLQIWSLLALGNVETSRGQLVKAKLHYEAADAVSTTAGNVTGQAHARYHLGCAAVVAGDIASARTYLSDSLAGFRATQDIFATALPLNELGFVARVEEDWQQALELYKESLATTYEGGMQRLVLNCLADLAGVARALGHPLIAVRWFGAVDKLLGPFKQRLHAARQATVEQDMAQARAQLEADVASRVWAEGSTLSLAEAVAEALAFNDVVERT